MVAMAQLIDAAVASKPDGLVVSIPDADALGPSIKAAVAAGIPVISMNSGSDVAQELGVLNHVGQTEYEAGLGAGQRMGEAGVTNALCVNQEVGNVALDQRCKRLHRWTGQVRRHGRSARGRPDQPDRSAAADQAALTSDPDIDGILTLGPTGAAPALAALKRNPASSARSSSRRSTSRRTCCRRSSTATCSSRSISSSTCRATCRSSC